MAAPRARPADRGARPAGSPRRAGGCAPRSRAGGAMPRPSSGCLRGTAARRADADVEACVARGEAEAPGPRTRRSTPPAAGRSASNTSRVTSIAHPLTPATRLPVGETGCASSRRPAACRMRPVASEKRMPAEATRRALDSRRSPARRCRARGPGQRGEQGPSVAAGSTTSLFTSITCVAPARQRAADAEVHAGRESRLIPPAIRNVTSSRSCSQRLTALAVRRVVDDDAPALNGVREASTERTASSVSPACCS